MTRPAAPDDPEPHLEPGEVARHVAGTSPPAERTRVEAHLAACDRCTDDVIAAWHYRERPRRRPALLGIGIAAAAAIVGLLLLPTVRGPSRTVPVVRGAGPSSTQVLTVVAPGDKATVSRPIVLTWHSEPDMATYKVSLAAADGDSVWAVITPDTTVSLPDSVGVTSGQDYLWYVDGLRADGRALSSGIHRFRLGQ